MDLTSSVRDQLSEIGGGQLVSKSGQIKMDQIKMDQILDSMDTGTDLSQGKNATRGKSPSIQDGVLQHLYGPVAEFLLCVEDRLRQELQSPYESVAPLLRHGVQLGGKRLRPAMHLLVAEAIGGCNEDNVVISTVLEMVHTATLVHDDVLDDASTRRHVPTVNAQWNNHTSILLGDYLFAQSFRLAATLNSTQACQWIGEAARLVCEGELRQVLTRDQLELDFESYISVIQGKTAELCRVACQLAAVYADASSDVTQNVADYGTKVGIAFQIADDYLDLWGDDRAVGKTLGTDLQQGKITLPVIRLLETASEKDRKSITQILTGPADQRVRDILPWLNASDAKSYTEHVARSYQQDALQHLSVLADSSAKDSLIAIARFAVDRRF
ncbi:polyprenyl synthetase family protein [Stieleria varia]|uniref:Heptaprenyl diphosphate synthase component 2 n=1 Tax=Stieleria varia TaxID=2528005 RepID=A0A5C6AMF8_9BACT|nr:polyprenyl synthetase family protein [Stieleria varia]TWU01243.1 Heptaprenyl diphosphate synthase component 2 [Stieleria varia]